MLPRLDGIEQVLRREGRPALLRWERMLAAALRERTDSPVPFLEPRDALTPSLIRAAMRGQALDYTVVCRRGAGVTAGLCHR